MWESRPVSRRSTEPTDLNIYYVRKFMVGGVSPPPAKNAGETVTADCFSGGVADETNSGVIIDASVIQQGLNRKNGVAILGFHGRVRSQFGDLR